MTSNTTAKQEDLGTAGERDGRRALRFERVLDHPVDRVWSALTEPDQLKGWLAVAEELDLIEGGKVVLRWQTTGKREEWESYGVILPDDVDPEVEDHVHGTVTAVNPPTLLEFDTDRFGILRWELQDRGTGCALTFINVVADELGDEMTPQVLAGWHSHFDTLADALAGRPRLDWSEWSLDDWAQIRDRYAEALR
jgi:uncharacterized protein YndB with AHSA1/START domain